jgi:hypothetical protein
MCVQALISHAQTSTFESLPLDASGYWIGGNGEEGFTDGNAYFEIVNTAWWEKGFAYSNHTDVTTSGFMNQYSVYTGSGVGNSSQFAIGKGGSIVKLINEAKTKAVTGFYVANTTYAALDMKDGSSFSKKFGGASGNDPDYFQLAITGFRNGVVIADTVKFKLADYTFSDNSKDYILSTWRWVDLRPLGIVDSIIFLTSSTDVGNWGMNTPDYFAIDHFNEPLYDAAVVNGGTEAVFKDSPLFKSWANTCTITRGYQNIDNQSLGFASVGADENGTLKAGVNGVVSLGDAGVAILEFAVPIKNGVGADFAVFENGFDVGLNQYLELAFVEVSSDGINYVRFPAISKTNASIQTDPFGTTDAALLYNLAGKYVANYGTPFDLEELKNNPLLDVSKITHVKLVDVIGKINLMASSKDSLGNPVNDPFVTAFASSGFDLDAIGVINQDDLSTSINSAVEQIVRVYPNPSANQFNISLLNTSYLGAQCQVYDVTGNVVSEITITETTVLDATSWNNGVYYIQVGNTTQKVVKID